MNCRFPGLIALLITVLAACSKDGGGNSNPTPVDTLAAGWKKVTMLTKEFSDIYFINNTGYVLGDGIYRSTDGGNNWQKVYQYGLGFSNIAMGSETNIAFAGQHNKILFTKNGGASFDSVTLNDRIIDVFFVNATTAYAIGDKFWKTIDAGSNWTKIYDFPSAGVYRSLHFTNELNGWMAGNAGSVYKTTNGGVSWEQKTVGFDLDFNGMGNPFFADQNYGYVTDGIRVAKTTNSGNSWSKVFTGDVNLGSFKDLHFINADVGYLTEGKYLYKTINGGTTWTKELVLANTYLYEIHFTDTNHGWACGGGGVYKYEK